MRRYRYEIDNVRAHLRSLRVVRYAVDLESKPWA